MAQATAKTRVSRSISPRYGHVFLPESRAYFAYEAGKLDPGALNQLESGKFFPKTTPGLKDALAPDDSLNNTPPADGKIASAGNPTAAFLDAPGSDWQKHEVQPGATLVVSWDYSTRHVTRRWNYFMTREDWQPDLPLSRAQFEELPFYKVELTEQPYWQYDDALMPPKPTEHELILPTRTGYHVLLAVWEVANTGNAFYQVIDLDFLDDGSDTDIPPTSPGSLLVNGVTEDSVSLSWSPATAGTWPIAQHKLYRNGTVLALIEAGENQYTDYSVLPSTKYTYYVTGVDTNGNESLPGPSINVVTSNAASNDSPPTQPLDLHSTDVTANSVELQWSASTSSEGVANYIVYRDGVEIGRTSALQLSYVDSGLSPDTRYRYFVAAIDTSDKLSVPSNVLAETTNSDTGSGSEPPAWAPYTTYAVGDKVTYDGSIYVCLQAHTASDPTWTPVVTINNLWRLV